MKLDELNEKFNRPYVYRKAGIEWLAAKQWSLNYFVNNYGSEIIYVMDSPDTNLIGLDSGKKEYVEMLLEDFISKIQEGQMTEDAYFYMFQSKLLEKNENLKNQYSFPNLFLDYTWVDYLWISPDVAKTPLHFDRQYIISYQVTGSKKFIFYSPDNPGEFYRINTEPKLSHFSTVDPYSIDRNLFPNFPESPDFEFDLHKGDILYIPPRWWHCVISTETSISVTRNWEKPK